MRKNQSRKHRRTRPVRSPRRRPNTLYITHSYLPNTPPLTASGMQQKKTAAKPLQLEPCRPPWLASACRRGKQDLSNRVHLGRWFIPRQSSALGSARESTCVKLHDRMLRFGAIPTLHPNCSITSASLQASLSSRWTSKKVSTNVILGCKSKSKSFL